MLVSCPGWTLVPLCQAMPVFQIDPVGVRYLALLFNTLSHCPNMVMVHILVPRVSLSLSLAPWEKKRRGPVNEVACHTSYSTHIHNREKWRLFQLFCNRIGKLCFVISVVNNKTIIPLNLAEYPLSFSSLTLTVSSAKYQATFHAIPQYTQ